MKVATTGYRASSNKRSWILAHRCAAKVFQLGGPKKRIGCSLSGGILSMDVYGICFYLLLPQFRIDLRYTCLQMFFWCRSLQNIPKPSVATPAVTFAISLYSRPTISDTRDIWSWHLVTPSPPFGICSGVDIVLMPLFGRIQLLSLLWHGKLVCNVYKCSTARQFKLKVFLPRWHQKIHTNPISAKIKHTSQRGMGFEG